MSEHAYKIKDTGPAGGIVFAIIDGKGYECAPEDFDITMTWQEALDSCKRVFLGGATDWYLPSKDELKLLYTVLAENGQSGFTKNWYWSSSQINIYDAWRQHFANGSRSNLGKYTSCYVRAVRAFDLCPLTLTKEQKAIKRLKKLGYIIVKGGADHE